MYCEHPNIIVNKNLYRNFMFGRKLVFCDGKDLYPLNGHVPSPSSVGATYENYKNWTLLTEDGEMIPVYVAVPCGHCILCSEKRGREWSTRALCETAVADYPPVFVTLTYADGYIPYDGVCKRDLQLFLKRLRENWFRKYGVRLNLRYFAVSEYGTYGGRPHYHLLLWNVPNQGLEDMLSIQCIYDVVARSWSEECSKKWYDSLPKNRYKFLQYAENEKYYTLFGKIDVSPDKGKSSGYCMKYMRKPKDVPQNWSQPTFYLSSRRNGGIGVPYLNKQMDAFRRSPQMMTVPVPVDRGTSVKEYGLPRVFKEKIFPSLSCILPVYIRHNIERFETIYKVLQKKTYYGVKYGEKPTPMILQDENKHGILYHMRESLRQHYGRCYDFINRSREWNKLDELYPTPRGYVTDREERLMYTELKFLFVQLYEYQPNTNALERFIGLKDKRQELLARLKIPDIDIVSERFKITSRIRLGRLREKL